MHGYSCHMHIVFATDAGMQAGRTAQKWAWHPHQTPSLVQVALSCTSKPAWLPSHCSKQSKVTHKGICQEMACTWGCMSGCKSTTKHSRQPEGLHSHPESISDIVNTSPHPTACMVGNTCCQALGKPQEQHTLLPTLPTNKAALMCCCCCS